MGDNGEDQRLGPGAGSPGQEPARGLPAEVWRRLRRLFVAVVGGTVVLIGVAMLFLPGPAVLVIPAGLAILATEFLWARRWLRRAKAMFDHARGHANAARGDEAGGRAGAMGPTGQSWWERLLRPCPPKRGSQHENGQ